MLILGADCPIWLCTQATDMRRSFDGLSAMVRNHMGAGPTAGHWFVFMNRRRTLLKVLAFDGDGYWIWSKRLETGQIAAPGRSADGKRAQCRSPFILLLYNYRASKSIPTSSHWNLQHFELQGLSYDLPAPPESPQ